ncbi:hypothetical protein, partial [Rhizobium leguminosarum]|uniref:hypothetical protein n=1 Tax=Rhizobium leguminosarum TaxID=384 RepID=UPI001C91C73B
APNSRPEHKPAIANPLEFHQNERLRRQQRRRPRSVSGLIELTNQNSQQRFSKKLIFLSRYCFFRENFTRAHFPDSVRPLHGQER